MSLAGIIILSILGGIILISIIYSLGSKASDSYKKSQRLNQLKEKYYSHNYVEFLKELCDNDVPSLFSVEQIITSLSKANLSVHDTFNHLRRFGLVTVPGSGKYSYATRETVHKSIPPFIFSYTEYVVDKADKNEVLLLNEILTIVGKYANTNTSKEYAPIDSSLILTNSFVDSIEEKPSENELLRFVDQAKVILGQGIDSGTERERRLLRAQSENYRKEHITTMNRLDSYAQKRTDNLQKKKEELEDYKDEYKKKLKELEEREKKDDIVLKNAQEKVASYEKRVDELIEKIESGSNKQLLPYLANAIADIKTLQLERTAEALNWGEDQNRLKKAKSLLEIRKEVKEQLEDAQVSYYQLKYLLELFPSLQDVLDAEYKDIEFDLTDFDYNENDPVRYFMSAEEWQQLSETERNQLALDRYVASHSKNNWQIGRDYELYIGQKYLAEGYDVDFTGSYMGLEDMGRDLICKKEDKTLIVQCKYWSKDKTIHENHVNQLFGTMTTYCIENNISPNKVKGVFITNTKLSDTATKFAELLKIEVIQDKKMEDFPRIKCNIGVDEYGNKTHIYHLPMDLSYDVAKIVNPGEFFAKTVKEAENAGFRRSYKWHGDGE
ncbi:MAG: restriction endonuclease [Bacilli bacterium]|nr:restriction endonuclease [Bacilli bacterium]